MMAQSVIRGLRCSVTCTINPKIKRAKKTKAPPGEGRAFVEFERLQGNKISSLSKARLPP
jgi:hypothetical protein